MMKNLLMHKNPIVESHGQRRELRNDESKSFLKTSVVVLLVCMTVLANAQGPWQEHGKLEVSPNEHYIQHEDGTPFLWIGDTGWGMFQQLTREEVDQYLDSRQVLGFTVIQSVAHWSPHGGGMRRSPNNAANAYDHMPFKGDEKSPNTAEPLSVKGGSPTSPNDYWDHADYIINAVKKRGMYLALLPTWGSHLITKAKEFTREEAKTYGSFLGERYKEEPNIIWVLGGDTKAFVPQGGVTKEQLEKLDYSIDLMKFDDRHIYRAMAEGIVRGVTGDQPAWNESHPAWDEVFLTYHPNGDAHDNSSDWFHKDIWLDANGVEVWGNMNAVYPVMLIDYQLTDPVKPSLFLEGSYEYGTYSHECGWVTPVRVRRQFYHTFFAGGAGHTYGAGPIWAMRGNDGDYNCGYTWQQALDFPGAVQIADVARQFLLDHKWHEWIPNGKVISGVGKGESLKTAVTTESNDMALIYYSNNSTCRVKNVFNKDTEAYWFYPRNGQKEQASSFKENESRDMKPPSKWEDAILVLQIAE